MRIARGALLGAAVVIALATLVPTRATGSVGRAANRVALADDGLPIDITVGAGSVWVLDGNNDRTWVERIDPARQRVTARIPVRQESERLVGDARGVWVDTLYGLVRIDPRRNQVVDHVRDIPTYDTSSLVAGADAVWVAGDALRDPFSSTTLVHIDPDTHGVVARIPVAGSEPLAAATDGMVGVVTYVESSGLVEESRAVLTLIDPTTNQVTSTDPQSWRTDPDYDGAEAITIDSRTALAIERDTLWRVDDTAHAWIPVVKLAKGACDCSMSIDRPGSLWISELGARRVIHVALATSLVDRSISISRPVGVAIGFGRVWVPDQDTKDVVVMPDPA